MFKRFSSFIAALAIGVMAAGCTQIDSGNVGVERSFGKVSTDEKPQGVYLTVFDSVDEYTTKEVSFSLNDMKPKSKDNLTISDLDVDIYFKVNPTKVADLAVKYQGDATPFGELVATTRGNNDLVVGYNRVLREAREAVYNAIAKFDATKMHTQRNEIAAEVAKTLQSQLNANDPDSFVITAVNVRNLVTDEAIENAIRAQVATDQQITQKQKQIELQKAEAERLRVEALGQAQANEIISASLTPNLLRLKELEAQRAFAGAGTHTVLLPADTKPLINIAGK